MYWHGVRMNKNPVPMRQAKPAEAEAVSQLLQTAGQALVAQGFDNWSLPYPQELIREQAAQGFVWVLDQGGEFLATLTLDFTLPQEYQAEWFSEVAAPAAYLHRLAVHPSQQGTGLGGYCLREAERIGQESGREWLRFDAYSRNAGIQAFYRKHGCVALREFQMKLPTLPTPEAFTLFEKRLVPRTLS